MEDKNKAIVEKVSAMYLEYGIRGVTMDDIAHKLSISKKTLYEYFSDKKELVSAVLENARVEWDTRFESIDCSNISAIDELIHFYEIQVKMIKSNKPAFIYDLKKYYPEMFNRFHSIKQNMILNRFENNIIKGKKEGLYREDINVGIIAKLNLMRFEGITNSEFFSIDDLLSPDLFTEIFKYHIYGIVNEKGRELVDSKFSNKANSKKPS